MTLTKGEIVKKLHANTSFSKERCAELVEGVFELMKGELAHKNDVLISGFGKWSVKKKSPRKGRNPQTGEELMLDSRHVVTFKCSRKLKETVNV
ncbi:MAG: integration host factor subunit alpha [Deltaproteobacteria bacterium]|nr:integration host factor subunit alpha [Deltaproteobacteria bacterium]